MVSQSGPRRGDLLSSLSADDSTLKTSQTRGMQRCVGEHNNCQFTFYHDNVESDEYFTNRVLFQ